MFEHDSDVLSVGWLCELLQRRVALATSGMQTPDALHVHVVMNIVRFGQLHFQS